MPQQDEDALAKRYRKHAEEFRAGASELKTEVGRQAWLDLAKKWDLMAEKEERRNEERRLKEASNKSTSA